MTMKPSAIIPIVVVFALCLVGLWWISRPVPVQVDSSHQWQLDSLTSVANEANARSEAYLAYADSCARVADSLSRIRQNPDAVILEAARGLGSPDVDSFRVILTEPSK